MNCRYNVATMTEYHNNTITMSQCHIESYIEAMSLGSFLSDMSTENELINLSDQVTKGAKMTIGMEITLQDDVAIIQANDLVTQTEVLDKVSALFVSNLAHVVVVKWVGAVMIDCYTDDAVALRACG